MDKHTAGELIKKTFQSPFDRDSFVYFIKNLLNYIEEAPFVYRGNFIPKAFNPYIKTLERIGKYTDTEDKELDILIVQLKKEASLEHARTMQRNFIAWYLNGSRGGKLKEAALVAFVPPNNSDWRFSYVKMEYKLAKTKTGRVRAKEELTPARRFSFLVGVNESSHTAQSRLAPILQDDNNNPTLKQLEEAFSIERVTKKFFGKYRNLYLRIKETLDEIVKEDIKIKNDFKEKNVSIVDFSKKLLGQIVFLYFLQKKGWFGVKRREKWGSGSKDFLRELFEKRHGDYRNFFNDILEPLFYEALRQDCSYDDDYYSRFDCRIPFLNGGLFDPLNNYDWVNTDILISNELFSNDYKTKDGDIGTGILDVFDRYNFTVKEDEPLEKEVAVDPEMLGKVFENLLEVKDRKSKGTYYTPREIVHYMCQESLINYLATELEDKKVKREDIEMLIKYGETVVEHETEVVSRDKETKTYSYKLPKSIRDNAKAIDKKLADIRVCDPAIGSGAFLVGMMNEIIRARNALTPFFRDKKDRTTYNFKRHAIQNCLYGVDIDPGAVEIAKLRLWLSLVVDEEDIKQIKPLPNLDYKIVCGNSLLGVEKNLFNANLFSKLEELKPLFFNETNPKKKQEYKKQIDELISKITNGHKDFDFEIYFSEVFHEKGGFDVVIANPPYVKEYVNRNAFDALRNSPYYQGKMDLWYMFACWGIDLIKDKGVVTFIAQNNWVTSYGASKMRDKVIQDTQILALLDFGDFKVFETAGIQTMVMIFKKDNSQKEYAFDYRKIINDKPVLNDVIDLLNKNENKNCQYLKPFINREKLLGKSLVFSDSKVEVVLDKIYKASNFHLQNKEVAQGIVAAPDKYFIISNLSKFTKKELYFIKPFYTYTNKYNLKPTNFYIFYLCDKNFGDKNINNYPNIKKHFQKFKKQLQEAKKRYGTPNKPYFYLHRERDERFFKKSPKIVGQTRTNFPNFLYTEEEYYGSRAMNFIKTNRIDLKYLVALLNSKLIYFWLKNKGKKLGNMLHIDKDPLLEIPLIKPKKIEQKRISKIVDKILAITKDENYLNNPTKQAKVRDYEKQIDQMVYKLYGLTEEEIKVVENYG